MKNLKLYGLQRTCTNVAAFLVEANFEGARVWHGVDGRWKHGVPRDLGFDGYLCCVKGPFAWVASMLRYRPAALSGLVALWNEYNRALLEFAARQDTLLVRHEDIVRDWRNFCDEVRYGLELEPVAFPYTGQPNAMLRGGDEMRGGKAVGQAPFNAAYYEERKFMDGFTPGQRGVVLRKLCRPLARALAYEADLNVSAEGGRL